MLHERDNGSVLGWSLMKVGYQNNSGPFASYPKFSKTNSCLSTLLCSDTLLWGSRAYGLSGIKGFPRMQKFQC